MVAIDSPGYSASIDPIVVSVTVFEIFDIKAIFPYDTSLSELNQKQIDAHARLLLLVLLVIELGLRCQMYDQHFKFEEDRTKTAVAIEDHRYSFGQTTTSSDFISVQCHELHWTDNKPRLYMQVMLYLACVLSVNEHWANITREFFCVGLCSATKHRPDSTCLICK